MPRLPIAPPADPAGLRLRDVLAVPFPSEATAAPRGDRAAWIVNDAGCRNVWVAEGDGPARALTRFQGDDGMALRQLRWLPGGDGVVFARGALPGDEEPPFPARPPHDAGQPVVWLARLDGTGPRPLGPGQSPEVSPEASIDGGRVAWLRDGQVWTVSLAPGAEPERLLADRGTCGALAWAPDGTRLAFVSDRGEQAFVGVADLATRAVRWIAPGVDRDAFPAWSPDGRHLAFVRLAEPATPTYLARPSGTPWSLWVADAATGAAHCAWTAAPGAGSVFAPLPAGPQIAWTADHRLVFPWEGSGWRHLHAVEAAGDASQAAQDLTPGAFEVFAMAPEPARGAIVCTANRGDLDGRRLWRVTLATGGMAPLTDADGIVDAPSVGAAGQVVVLRADALTPLHPLRLAGEGAARPLAGGRPLAGLAVPQTVVFASGDGLELHAQLFLPPAGAAAARHPAIVHFHGGPARQMLPAWHPIEVYHLQYGLNQLLASRGFVVLSVNYRGGIGQGLGFREPPGFGAGGASEHQDAVAAAHWLRGRADVDPLRIGACGTSYGGLMTALALARSPALFAAGVDCAGVSDWRPAFAGAGVTGAMAEAAFGSSPIADAGAWRAPALFIHADDDRTVPFGQTVALVKALRRRPGAQVEHLVLPDEQHDFLRRESWERTFAATIDFFERTLR